MSFSETEKLIQLYNENPSASWCESGGIAENRIGINNNIEMCVEHEDVVKKRFRKEYDKNNKNRIYYFGCPLETYKFTYNSRYQEFIRNYPDALEAEFIFDELGVFTKEFRFPYVDITTRLGILSSLRRREEYLLEKLDDLGYHYYGEEIINDTLDPPKNVVIFRIDRNKKYEPLNIVHPIDANISQTQFMELFKALFDSKFFKDSNQTDALKSFSKYCKININNPDKLLQDIKKRMNGNETLYIDKLKTSLLDFFNK